MSGGRWLIILRDCVQFWNGDSAEKPGTDDGAAVPPVQKHVKFAGFREGPRPRGPLRGGFSAESIVKNEQNGQATSPATQKFSVRRCQARLGLFN